MSFIVNDIVCVCPLFGNKMSYFYVELMTYYRLFRGTLLLITENNTDTHTKGSRHTNVYVQTMNLSHINASTSRQYKYTLNSLRLLRPLKLLNSSLDRYNILYYTPLRKGLH